MKESILRGAVGLLSLATGEVISHIPQIEEGLRIVSLMVGIAVGIATLDAMYQAKKRNKTISINLPGETDDGGS